MDEILDQQAQNTGDANLEVASPATENNTTQDQAGQDDGAASAQDLSDQEERKPSRAERRIREQNSRIRELESQLMQAPAYQPPAFTQQQGDGELTADQVFGTTQLQAEAVGRRNEKSFQFQLDMRDVMADYPELNPDSDQYDPDLDQEVAQMYEELGGVYGNSRLSSVVKRVFKIATRNEAKTQVETAKTLARQAADGALTPTAAKVSSGGPNVEALFQVAVDSGSDADWAKYFKALRS